MKHDKPSAFLTMVRPQWVRKARRWSSFRGKPRNRQSPTPGTSTFETPQAVKRKYQEVQKASKERFTGSEEWWTSA